MTEARVAPGSRSGPALAGRWVSEDGMVAEFLCHDDGRLSGHVRWNRDAPLYRPYEIVGTWLARPDGTLGMVGSVIGWPTKSTMTVWHGELEPGEGVLRTKWLSAGGEARSTSADPDNVDSNGGATFRRDGQARDPLDLRGA